jgi:hypothetical protein
MFSLKVILLLKSRGIYPKIVPLKIVNFTGFGGQWLREKNKREEA